MSGLYLDYAATTPLNEEVLEEMLPFLKESFGNPSSLYFLGQKAKKAIETAREKVASFLNAKKREIIFTSSGTESNNLAFFGIVGKNSSAHIITSQIEHPSILQPCKELEKKGIKVTYLPVDTKGTIDIFALKNAIDKNTLLVSIMHANNEIGTIQPLEKISSIIQEKKKQLKKEIYFHTDAVQSASLLPIDVEKLKIDLLTLSSHKIYGPKGAGALFVRKNTPFFPIILGGGQEMGLRSSTENVPAIVGFGKACFLAKKNRKKRREKLLSIQKILKEKLFEKVPHLVLNGHPVHRLPNNIHITVKYIEGEAMLYHLDKEKIFVSTGSACSSSTLLPSHVLLAIGIPKELAHSSLRITFGEKTTKQDIEHFLNTFPKIAKNLRNISPLYNEKE